jgi:adenylate cyclase
MDSRQLKRTLIIGAISFVISAVCFLKTGGDTGFSPSTLLYLADHRAQDYLAENGRPCPIDTNLFEYFGIDDTSYRDRFFQVEETAAEFPEEMTRDDHIMLNTVQKKMGDWSREVWAEVAERVMEAGARCLVIDIYFHHDEERVRGDQVLGEVIQKYSPAVIIGSEVQNSEDRTSVSGPPLSIIPDDFMDNSQHPCVGLVNIYPDSDGCMRRGVYQFSNHDCYRMMWDGTEHLHTMGDFGKDVVFPSLSARATTVMGYETNLPPVSERPLIRFTGVPGTFVMNSIADLLDPDVFKTGYADKGRLKGKLVLIGPHNALFQDIHTTPFGSMPGPEYHLNLINAAINAEFIDETTFGTDQLIVLAAGFLTILLTLMVKGYSFRFYLGLLLSAGFFGFAWWQYNYNNLLLGSIAVPILLLNTSNIITLACQSIWTYADKREFEGTMGKYFSPAILKEIMNNPKALAPKNAELTLLLTDLRNSTPLAERLGPSGMFKLLNQIFEAQTEAVLTENGSLEHFLGDQFLSYWGAPYDQPDGPNQALRAARDLIVRMEGVKQIQESKVSEIFGYGVALHTGQALAGEKGSEKKKEYGLVGDTINEAARIEALTKYYGAQLLVSQEIFTKLTDPGRNRLVDRVIVKGKSEPVVLYELEQSNSSENFDAIGKEFTVGFDLYSEGKFSEAQAIFEKMIKDYNDGPSKPMLERCIQLLAEPDPDWKGVWKMENK